MSTREKRLLILFATAGFVIVNFLLFGFYTQKRDEIRTERQNARNALDMANLASQSRELVADEMEWLAEHEPEPRPYQDEQSELQQFAESQARAMGLEVKKVDLLSTEPGTHFSRVRVQLRVVGMEQPFYRWIVDSLNDPNELRAVTFLNLRPNPEDDTKLEATVIVEKWFVQLQG